MNTKKSLSIKLVILAIFILVISLTLLYISGKKEVKKTSMVRVTPVVTQVPTPYLLSGSYQIILSKNKVKVGEKVSAAVEFSVSDRKIFGSDLVLTFDPKLLAAETKLQTGEYFQNYPRQEVDNQNGLIRVTAFTPGENQPTGKVRVITAVFQAKKPGQATVGFDFEKRKTNLTTLVEEGTSRNILSEAEPAQIVIEQ